jgi:nitroimidazol reductase NimA-like FMN-containing flavoprotein (pyridoxamine 5'-phosphate oxidase superfamily)
MDDKDAYSIPEFCRRHGFSQSFYFAEARDGRMPRVMRVGARVLISKEAASDWRKEREASSIQKKAA